MNVHSEIGSGFPEIIYHRCLSIEFNEKGIRYQNELSLPLFYRGIHVGKRRVDFLIEDKVLIEIKAVSELDKSHINQILNYLNLFQIEVGLLLNFGEGSLKFNRFINSKPSRK